MHAFKRNIALAFFITGITICLNAQEVENDFQARTSLEMSYKPFKKLKLTLVPEARFDERFSLDEFLIESEVAYKPLKYLSLAATYRFISNPRDSKTTEYNNQYGLTATLKTDIKRFTAAFRLRYSDYADDEIVDKLFLRYKASLKYDIPKCKLTPFVAAEAIQQLDDGKLFKMRYSTGMEYKLFKNNAIGLSYKFDYYKQDFRNRHIVSLGYKIKF